MTLFKKEKKFSKADMLRFLCWWNWKYCDNPYKQPDLQDIEDWIKEE